MLAVCARYTSSTRLIKAIGLRTLVSLQPTVSYFTPFLLLSAFEHTHATITTITTHCCAPPVSSNWVPPFTVPHRYPNIDSDGWLCVYLLRLRVSDPRLFLPTSHGIGNRSSKAHHVFHCITDKLIRKYCFIARGRSSLIRNEKSLEQQCHRRQVEI